jgi:hypothetical protein
MANVRICLFALRSCITAHLVRFSWRCRLSTWVRDAAEAKRHRRDNGVNLLVKEATAHLYCEGLGQEIDSCTTLHVEEICHDEAVLLGEYAVIMKRA